MFSAGVDSIMMVLTLRSVVLPTAAAAAIVRCWEGWSETQAATCPSCKQPSAEVPAQQQTPQQPCTP